MADTDILVSEMTPASQINTTDLMIMTQPDSQAETGYSTKSGTVLQVANKMLKGTEYSTDLPDFTDKTPLGGLEELKADIKALLPVSSASGNPCTFETNLADTLASLIANITASGGYDADTQTEHPIVGHSELNLVRCGKNIAADNYVNSSTSRFAMALYIETMLKPDTFYTLSFEGNAGNEYYTNESLTTQVTVTVVSGRTNVTFKTLSAISKSTSSQYDSEHGWRILKNNKNQDYANLFTNIQLEEGQTATAYEPYNGQTFTVSFGQTVYGGVYDANAGKVRITHKDIDLDSLTWTYNSTYDIWVSSSGINDTISDHLLAETFPYAHIGLGDSPIQGSYINGHDNIWVRNGSTDTAPSGKAVYELATPIEIDVSELSVDTIVGVNNIISDCGGDVEVQYRDSIQHYIDSKIASVQALIL